MVSKNKNFVSGKLSHFISSDTFKDMLFLGVAIVLAVVLPWLPLLALIIGIALIPFFALTAIYRRFYRQKMIRRLDEPGLRKDLGGLYIFDVNFEKMKAPLSKWSGSTLVRTNFKGANLNHADFENAELKQVNLSKADLRGANFSRTNLDEAQLKGARFSKRTLLPFSDQRALELGMIKSA